MSMPIQLYADGSCLANPNGPSGFGYVIKYVVDKEDGEMPQTKLIEGKKGFGIQRKG